MEDYINELTETPPETDEISNEDDTNDELINESAENVDNTDEEPTLTEENGMESKLAELQSELDKANGRMSEKDRYINELRNKPKEELEVGGDELSEDDDFWSDPEAKYKTQQNQLEQLQFQIAEQGYARTKADYYDLVNTADVNLAISKDPEFASEFNSSSNKFETAYNYMKKQTDSNVSTQAQMREAMRAELMEELGVKAKTPIPKSVSNVGSSNSNTSEASDDGFSDIFGASY